jgi:hypothetical protein
MLTETDRMISGAAYDWTKTLKPERPWLHDYSRALVMKTSLAKPNKDHSASEVLLTFSDMMEIIRQIDQMTPGLPKINYLVGWQYQGHDSKYPAWHEVNEALKTAGDKSALESLLRLFDEGFKYNTTVSLHINMYDAYISSPLWQTYCANGLIALEEGGLMIKGGVYNGLQAYAVSYKNEWDSGFAKKRIDELCAMIPLVRAGTVHIDAFHCHADAGHGYTMVEAVEARNKIFRYWRNLGIDVTSEFLYNEAPHRRDALQKHEHLIGLMPHAYHLSQTLNSYLHRPASLISGMNTARPYLVEGIPLEGLFGDSVDAEGIIRQHYPVWQLPFFTGFMEKSLKQLYLNSLERLGAEIRQDNVTVQFSNGVETALKGIPLSRNGISMENENGLFIPAEWIGKGAAIVYSRDGKSCQWDASGIMDWKNNAKVCIRGLSVSGLAAAAEDQVLENGTLELKLPPHSAVVVNPI